MSTIGSRHFLLNNENSTLKNSERKHTTKKQAFGEIKNVLHNKETRETPFKGDLFRNQIATSKPPSIDSMKKPLKVKSDTQKKIDTKPKLLQKDFVHLDLDEDFEIGSRTCHKGCNRDLFDIWCEGNILEPEVLEKFVNFKNNEKDDDMAKNNRHESTSTDKLLAQLNLSHDFEIEKEDINSWGLFSDIENKPDFDITPIDILDF